MSNIFTYGWKVKVDPASMQAALRGLSSPDDAITWAAVLACMAFYAAALLIERLGLVLLQREARVRRTWLLFCDFCFVLLCGVQWNAVQARAMLSVRCYCCSVLWWPTYGVFAPGCL
jgi:hypothetical protein